MWQKWCYLRSSSRNFAEESTAGCGRREKNSRNEIVIGRISFLRLFGCAESSCIPLLWVGIFCFSNDNWDPPTNVQSSPNGDFTIEMETASNTLAQALRNFVGRGPDRHLFQGGAIGTNLFASASESYSHKGFFFSSLFFFSCNFPCPTWNGPQDWLAR